MTTTALTRIPQQAAPTPAQTIQQVFSVAEACRTIVGASAMELGGRLYVRVEGWQAIATAHGCSVSIDQVEDLPGLVSGRLQKFTGWPMELSSVRPRASLAPMGRPGSAAKTGGARRSLRGPCTHEGRWRRRGPFHAPAAPFSPT